jgi:hypothetical protein
MPVECYTIIPFFEPVATPIMTLLEYARLLTLIKAVMEL